MGKIPLPWEVASLRENQCKAILEKPGFKNDFFEKNETVGQRHDIP